MKKLEKKFRTEAQMALEGLVKGGKLVALTDEKGDRTYQYKQATYIICTVVSHDFVKGNIVDLANQLVNFSDKLNGLSGPTALAIKYGLTSGELLEIKNDAKYVKYFADHHLAGAEYSKAWTNKGQEILKGTGPSVMAWPLGLDVSTAPTDVPPGAIDRFRLKAKKIKDAANYSSGDGDILGIEPVVTPFVPAAGKPDLIVTISGGGHPMIEYTKGNYAGIRIYKDSGDGKGFVYYATCNDPSCKDLSPLPAKDVSVTWKYKASYVYKSEEVGTMSNEAPISVRGLVTVPTP